ncbi:FkbM family methyltransferase [Limibacter armeniacum]|uniref:FkbM family methyltransferase n=1 Tax=Limibacter armeniacum TaxID=466084 RepID=UPI002FE6BC93
MIKELKRFYFKSKKGIWHLSPKVKCKYSWYGNDYGGFYVCDEILGENAIVYSFGIGLDISFDRTMIERYGCQVFGFDPTPKSIQWVSEQVLPDGFTFFDFGIANKTGYVDFNLPKNPDYVSGSAVVHSDVDSSKKVSVLLKSLVDITESLGHQKIDVLKMDIEGFEYKVIDSILSSPVEIDQILIEFHDRFFDKGIECSKKAVQKLSEAGYDIFAVSDSFEEVSFIRRDLIK